MPSQSEKKKWIIRPLLFSALCVLIFFCTAISVYAAPPLPAEFYGSITIDGSQAPAGTLIIAKVNGAEHGRIQITSPGIYGGTGTFDQRLVVSLSEDEYAPGSAQTIQFYVNGVKGSPDATFSPGLTQKNDLTFTNVGPITPVTTTRTKPVTTTPTTWIPTWTWTPTSTITGAGVGYFKIQSNPTGADVTFDGEYKGQTPVTIPVYSTSTPLHTLKLSKYGYSDYYKDIKENPASGKTITYTIALTKIPYPTKTVVTPTFNPGIGYYSIITAPVGGEITFDGVYVGTAPVTVPVYSTADPWHSLRIRMYGYYDYNKDITGNPASGKTITYRINLVKNPYATPSPTIPPLMQSNPSLPHAFYGKVKFIDENAPVGVLVEVQGAGVYKSDGNPVTISTAGQYGEAGTFGSKLYVQGDIQENTPLTFLVSGQKATLYDVKSGKTMDTYPFHAGDTSNVDLSLNVIPPTKRQPTIIPDGGGGGGGGGSGGSFFQPDLTTPVTETATVSTPAPTSAEGSGQGSGSSGNSGGAVQPITKSMLPTDANGTITQPFSIVSDDGVATFVLSPGIKALDSQNNPLTDLKLIRLPGNYSPNVPDGAGYLFLGYAYALTPDGATFSPPASLRFTIPQDRWDSLQQNDLLVKTSSLGSGTWEDVPSTVDAASRTVTASVSHFSIFGLFQKTGNQTQVPLTPVVTTLATPVPKNPSQFPWLLLLPVIIGVPVIAFLVYFMIINKKMRSQKSGEVNLEKEKPDEENLPDLDELDLGDDDLEI